MTLLTLSSAREKLAKLDRELSKHNELYYNADAPRISDADYDKIKHARAQLLQDFPELAPQSTLPPVGAAPTGPFPRAAHMAPLYSLDNVFDKADVEAFVQKIQRFIGNSAPLTFVGEPKIDGLSIALVYEKGTFVRAATRGDGTYGDVITENARFVQGIPHTLKGSKKPNLMEIRGEVYLTKNQFLTLNQERTHQGLPLFANPRNAAAGSMRQLDPHITKERALSFLPHGIFTDTPLANTYQETMERLAEWGFSHSPSAILKTIEDIEEYHQEMQEKRAGLAFDIDGTVYKLNDLNLWNRLGYSHKAPRFAFAFKFDPEVAITMLRDIRLQVGRLGTLTPVAHLEPVSVGGVLVTRASLHNQDELSRKDIRIGDTVSIHRAGDVIPQVTGVLYEKRPPDTQPFAFPDTCPVCSAPVKRLDHMSAWRCTGGLHCPAQAIERLKHFVSRDAFDIPGCGVKNITFLWKKGWVRTPSDLFTLQKRNQTFDTPLEKQEGWGALSASNLFESIQKRRHITLERFLYALGIPQLGLVTARLLAEHYLTFEALRHHINTILQGDANFDDLQSIHGIGPLIAQDLVNFFQDKVRREEVEDLLTHVTIHDTKRSTLVSHPLQGKKIVFTGTLSSLTRPEAKMRAQACGARVITQLSASTDILVAGTAPGSKLDRAHDLGVSVMDENAFLELLQTPTKNTPT